MNHSKHSSDTESSDGSPEGSPTSSPTIHFEKVVKGKNPAPLSLEETMRWKNLDYYVNARPRISELPVPQPIRELFGTCRGYATIWACRNKPSPGFHVRAGRVCKLDEETKRYL